MKSGFDESNPCRQQEECIMRSTFLCITWLLLCTISLHSEEPVKPNRTDDIYQSRLIKVKRMSETWRDAPVEIRLLDGTNYSGYFHLMRNDIFLLRIDDKIQEIPFMGSESIVLKRKPQDLLFVGLSAVGVAALFAGGSFLGFDAPERMVMGAAVVGAGIGFTLGWKMFYKDVVIPIKK